MGTSSPGLMMIRPESGRSDVAKSMARLYYMRSNLSQVEIISVAYLTLLPLPTI